MKKYKAGLTIPNIVVLLFFFFTGCTPMNSQKTPSLSSFLEKKELANKKPKETLNPISLTSPSENPITSDSGMIVISGTCDSRAFVFLSGDSFKNTACIGGVFAFQFHGSEYRTFQFQLVQSAANAYSTPPLNVVWIRDAGYPESPVITSPSQAMIQNNLDQVTIEGTCKSGNTIELSGDATSSTLCLEGKFLFNIEKDTDDSYQFDVREKNAMNRYSGPAHLDWIRDTENPNAPVLTNPPQEMTYQVEPSLNIDGSCESGSTVHLTGSSEQSTTCDNDSFHFEVIKAEDGEYGFSVSQTDLAGNSSENSVISWIKDSTIPALLTIDNHTSPYISNETGLVIEGSCSGNTNVVVSGATSESVSCQSGNYQINFTPEQDGTYIFYLKQVALSGLASDSIHFQWTRDTQAPHPVVLTNPASGNVTTAQLELNITGECENGAIVHLKNAGNDSTTCQNQSFQFTVNQATDGEYRYELTQTDSAGNESETTTVTWTIDLSVPPVPVISEFLPNPFYGNQTEITIHGDCTIGNKVILSGDDQGSTMCDSGKFSFVIKKTEDHHYQFEFRHESWLGTLSDPATFKWVLDQTPPEIPIVENPTQDPALSNETTLVLQGSCEEGATVNLSGDAGSHSTPCQSSTFSFNIPLERDGSFQLILNQTDLAGNTSSSIKKSRILDTVAPDQIQLINPASNPFISSNDELLVTGHCEPQAKIILIDGELQSELTCGETGSFQHALLATEDGVRTLQLSQTDLAGNSSAQTDLTWIRNTVIPNTPELKIPVSAPYFINSTTHSIVSTCDAEIGPKPALVTLGGDFNPPQTVECQEGSATFLIEVSNEASYEYELSQSNPNTSLNSGRYTFMWTLDTTRPGPPKLTNPSVSPITSPGTQTISGVCETGATVFLLGATENNFICDENGQYTFDLNQETDGTYHYEIIQTDAAQNHSDPVSFEWTKDSRAIPVPELSSPSENPYTSNLNDLLMTGTCLKYYTVTIEGDLLPQQSVECQDGTFVFKANTNENGTYAFNIYQSINSIRSEPLTLIWNRLQQKPSIEITESPSNPNLQPSATVSFTSDTGSSFRCKMDYDSGFRLCSSPFTIPATIPNGSRELQIIAYDDFDNQSDPVSIAFTQANYNTLALYHLNTGTEKNDSSSYTTVAGLFNNNLTAYGTTTVTPNPTPAADTTGVALSGVTSSRRFSNKSYYSTDSNNALNQITDQMTVEGFFKISTNLTTSSAFYTIASKTGGNGDQGWKIQIFRKSTGIYYLRLVLSTNGTDQIILQSNSFEIQSGSTGTLFGKWIYFAVTYQQGTAKFFLGATSATAYGTQSIASGPTTIFNSSGPLRIGADADTGSTSTSLYFGGSLDEIRISKTARSPVFPTTQLNSD